MSEEVYSIPLVKLAQEFSLEEIVIPDNYNDILITTPEISRPGLALAGFFEIFDAERIQMIGNAEHRYLIGLEPEERRHRIVNYIQARPVAVLYTTALPQGRRPHPAHGEKDKPDHGCYDRITQYASCPPHNAPRGVG